MNTGPNPEPDFDDPELRKQFDEELERLDAKFAPWIEAIRASERLTEEDYQLRITPYDND